MDVSKPIIITLIVICGLWLAQASTISSTGELEDRSFKSDDGGSGRTFGQIKKFQTALLPIMYKLGVMSAVIMMTLFLAFKGVFIGTLILVLNLTFFAVKFGSFLKHDQGHYISHQSGWTPPAHGWPPHKDVHLHIHNAHGKPEFSIPYSTLNGGGGWDTQGHATAVEPTWNTGGYVHSGRSLSDDSTPYPSTQTNTAIKSKVIEKRSNQEPTIVMAQTQPILTPYNYLVKPNRK